MKEINEILLKELERLNNDKLIEEKGELEIARGNAISKTAQAYLNSVNTNIKILNIADRTKRRYEKIKKALEE